MNEQEEDIQYVTVDNCQAAESMAQNTNNSYQNDQNNSAALLNNLSVDSQQQQQQQNQKQLNFNSSLKLSANSSFGPANNNNPNESRKKKQYYTITQPADSDQPNSKNLLSNLNEDNDQSRKILRRKMRPQNENGGPEDDDQINHNYNSQQYNLHMQTQDSITNQVQQQNNQHQRKKYYASSIKNINNPHTNTATDYDDTNATYSQKDQNTTDQDIIAMSESVPIVGPQNRHKNTGFIRSAQKSGLSNSQTIKDRKKHMKNGQTGVYYEDAIDSETEVFDNADEYNQKANEQSEINVVLQSNADDETKYELIQQIMAKYAALGVYSGGRKRKPPQHREIYFEDEEHHGRNHNSVTHHDQNRMLRKKHLKQKRRSAHQRGMFNSIQMIERPQLQNDSYLMPEINELSRGDHQYVSGHQMQQQFYETQYMPTKNRGQRRKKNTSNSQRRLGRSHSHSNSPKEFILQTERRNRFCECCNGPRNHDSSESPEGDRKKNISKHLQKLIQGRGKHLKYRKQHRSNSSSRLYDKGQGPNRHIHGGCNTNQQLEPDIKKNRSQSSEKKRLNNSHLRPQANWTDKNQFKLTRQRINQDSAINLQDGQPMVANHKLRNNQDLFNNTDYMTPQQTRNIKRFNSQTNRDMQPKSMKESQDQLDKSNYFPKTNQNQFNQTQRKPYPTSAANKHSLAVPVLGTNNAKYDKKLPSIQSKTQTPISPNKGRASSMSHNNKSDVDNKLPSTTKAARSVQKPNNKFNTIQHNKNQQLPGIKDALANQGLNSTINNEPNKKRKINPINIIKKDFQKEAANPHTPVIKNPKTLKPINQKDLSTKKGAQNDKSGQVSDQDTKKKQDGAPVKAKIKDPRKFKRPAIKSQESERGPQISINIQNPLKDDAATGDEADAIEEVSASNSQAQSKKSIVASQEQSDDKEEDNNKSKKDEPEVMQMEEEGEEEEFEFDPQKHRESQETHKVNARDVENPVSSALPQTQKKQEEEEEMQMEEEEEEEFQQTQKEPESESIIKHSEERPTSTFMNPVSKANISIMSNVIDQPSIIDKQTDPLQSLKDTIQGEKDVNEDVFDQLDVKDPTLMKAALKKDASKSKQEESVKKLENGSQNKEGNLQSEEFTVPWSKGEATKKKGKKVNQQAAINSQNNPKTQSILVNENSGSIDHGSGEMIAEFDTKVQVFNENDRSLVSDIPTGQVNQAQKGEENIKFATNDQSPKDSKTPFSLGTETTKQDQKASGQIKTDDKSKVVNIPKDKKGANNTGKATGGGKAVAGASTKKTTTVNTKNAPKVQQKDSKRASPERQSRPKKTTTETKTTAKKETTKVTNAADKTNNKKSGSKSPTKDKKVQQEVKKETKEKKKEVKEKKEEKKTTEKVTVKKTEAKDKKKDQPPQPERSKSPNLPPQQKNNRNKSKSPSPVPPPRTASVLAKKPATSHTNKTVSNKAARGGSQQTKTSPREGAPRTASQISQQQKTINSKTNRSQTSSVPKTANKSKKASNKKEEKEVDAREQVNLSAAKSQKSIKSAKSAKSVQSMKDSQRAISARSCKRCEAKSQRSSEMLEKKPPVKRTSILRKSNDSARSQSNKSKKKLTINLKETRSVGTDDEQMVKMMDSVNSPIFQDNNSNNFIKVEVQRQDFGCQMTPPRTAESPTKPLMVDQALTARTISEESSIIQPPPSRGVSINLSAITPNYKDIAETRSIAISAKQQSFKQKVDAFVEAIPEQIYVPKKAEIALQTDIELVTKMVEKKVETKEIETEPVVFQDEIKVREIQTQTMPIVAEHEVAPEPIKMQELKEPEKDKGMVMEAEPTSSKPAEVELPQPQEPPPEPEPYEGKDWAEAKLFQFVRLATRRQADFDGQFDQFEPGDRPLTPSDQKDATIDQLEKLNLNPENKNILSQQEAEYVQSLIKRKSTTFCTGDQLKEYYDRAVLTIEVLTENMLQPHVEDFIIETFYDNKEQDKASVIKLLLRVIILYEARVAVMKILRLIIEVTNSMKEKGATYKILVGNKKSRSQKEILDNHRLQIQDTLELIGRTLLQISLFKENNRLFTDTFYFNKQDYMEYLQNIGHVLGGFQVTKGIEPNSYLEDNGLLIIEHQKSAIMEEAYQNWFNQALATTGDCSLPPDRFEKRKPLFQQMLIPTNQKRGKKKSRIKPYDPNKYAQQSIHEGSEYGDMQGSFIMNNNNGGQQYNYQDYSDMGDYLSSQKVASIRMGSAMSMRSMKSMKSNRFTGFGYEDGNESVETIRENLYATKAVKNINYKERMDYGGNHLMFESDISSQTDFATNPEFIERDLKQLEFNKELQEQFAIKEEKDEN